MLLSLAAILLGCLWAQPALAAGAKIEVLGGEESRTVELKPASQHGGLHGRVTLLVRNASGKKAHLKIRFVPKGRANAIRVSANTKRISLQTKGTAQNALLLKKRQIRPLSLRFDLPPGEGPAGIDGTVVLRIKGEAKSIPIAGTLRPLKDVSVEPSTLVMTSDDDTATVTLVGSGLLDFLGSAGPSSPATVLHDESGNATEVEVQLPSPAEVLAGGNPNRAEATLKLSDAQPPAGKYTGKVLLSDLVSESPSVQVELRSHRSSLCLVGLAFLGVLFGGLLTRLISLAARRSLLLKVLDQSVAAYMRVHESGPTRSWRLEDFLDLPPAADGAARLQGVSGLTSSIETARSTKDLDEDAIRVLDAVARIQRWLRGEPVVRQLALVADSTTPPELGAPGSGLHRWNSSNTWRDTQILLAAARREPTSVEAADTLVAQLLAQARWHHRFSQAWSAVAGHAPLEAQLLKLDGSLGDTSTAESRKPEQRDELEAKLMAFARGPAASLGIAFSDPPTPPELPADAEIPPVRWSASPNSFTGWATLDAPSYGQLTRRALSSSRSLAMPSLWTEIRALRPADAGWTLLTLLLTCLLYGLSSYGETWGTTNDLIKAFLAGLLGTVVVNWAALPIFRSARLHAAEASKSA